MWPMRILTEALTFDDVSLVPAYSNVLPRDVSLATPLTRGIRLNIPILSAAMDTVTEARLAITMAQCGGIGIIHKNMPAAQQANEVRIVKKFEAGVIRDLITVKDIQKARDNPDSAKDSHERLRVGAAVGVGGDTEDRVGALVAAGVDLIIVDTAHGHSQGVIDRVRWVKRQFPQMQVIGGNIVT